MSFIIFLHVWVFFFFLCFYFSDWFSNSLLLNRLFSLEQFFFWFPSSLSPYAYYWAFKNVFFHFNSPEEFNILVLKCFCWWVNLHIWKIIYHSLLETHEKRGITTSGCEWSFLSKRRHSSDMDEVVFWRIPFFPLVPLLNFWNGISIFCLWCHISPFVLMTLHFNTPFFVCVCMCVYVDFHTGRWHYW